MILSHRTVSLTQRGKYVVWQLIWFSLPTAEYSEFNLLTLYWGQQPFSLHYLFVATMVEGKAPARRPGDTSSY